MIKNFGWKKKVDEKFFRKKKVDDKKIRMKISLSNLEYHILNTRRFTILGFESSFTKPTISGLECLLYRFAIFDLKVRLPNPQYQVLIVYFIGLLNLIWKFVYQTHNIRSWLFIFKIYDIRFLKNRQYQVLNVYFIGLLYLIWKFVCQTNDIRSWMFINFLSSLECFKVSGCFMFQVWNIYLTCFHF